jgi:hypothetical protein
MATQIGCSGVEVSKISKDQKSVDGQDQTSAFISTFVTGPKYR